MDKELKEIIEVSNNVSESNVPLEELIFPIDVKWLNKHLMDKIAIKKLATDIEELMLKIVTADLQNKGKERKERKTNSTEYNKEGWGGFYIDVNIAKQNLIQKTKWKSMLLTY